MDFIVKIVKPIHDKLHEWMHEEMLKEGDAQIPVNK